MMAEAAPVISHKHIFGLKADVKNNVHYLEENIVLYPAGHNVVIYNTDTKIQRFIHGSDVNLPSGRTEITALAVSPNKRYVAVAEKGMERATIHVYDVRTLKKRKTLTTPDCHSREYVSMCFSPDNKNLLTQGGAPDWALINWLWGKSKPLQITRVESKSNPVYQCSFCPSDPSTICVTGKNTLLFFRVEDGAVSLKPIETKMWEREAEDYLCHSWTTGRKMVAGTSTGNLLFFENEMFRSTLKSSPQNGKSIESIAAFSKGFVIGCDEGALKLYKDDPADNYKLSRSFTVAGNSQKIKCINISPSEDNLTLTTENCQVFLLKLFDTDVLKSEDMKFEPLSELFHSDQILGLDVCIRKPLVVTCGLDKSVRVWNYETKVCELCTFFNEVPYSIAFHPSGLHVLIGFADKLRLCHLLVDDVRMVKEFAVKACPECQFSNGGQYFAAVNNSGLVQVYNTYTCESVTVFRGGHTGNVKSLYWSLDDTSIISAGVDGAVYERRLANPQQRAQEWVQKGCRFTSALCTEDGKIYAVGDDRILKEIIDRSITKHIHAGVVLTQLVVSHPPQRMMFAGTANGVVRSFKFPLTGDVKDYQCHTKTITRMRIAQDDSYLFSVSEDGCLAIFNIKEKEEQSQTQERDVPFSEEILVTKSDLEEKNALMVELKGKVEELTASNQYQLRLHDMNYQERLKETSEKYSLQIQHDKSKIEMLKDEKQELDMEFEEKIIQLKTTNANKLHIQDLEHQKAIMKEVGCYQELQEQLEEDALEYDNQVREREIRHQEEMARLRDKFEMDLREEKAHGKQVNEAKNLIIREFHETKSQLEEDTDKEIEHLKDKYDTKLHHERDATLRLKGENGIMKKKFSALEKDIEDQKENIKEMAEEEKKLSTHIKKLEDRIKSHKEEIDERDRTIGEKEKQIYDLKKDNQELEKFKFVLDYQIKELKRQIEPRENDITDMKDRVMKMDGQLESYHKENGSQQQSVKDLTSTLQKKQNQIRTQRQKLRKQSGNLNSLANDLHQLVQVIQDPTKLKEGTKALYYTHVTERIQAAEVNPDVSKEYKRQRQYLERSVDVLKRKLGRDMKARKNDNMRVMQENVALIKEINKMRREIKLMHQVQRQRELNSSNADWEAQGAAWDEGEAYKILEMQRDNIENLRMRIEDSQQRTAQRAIPQEG